MNPSRRIRPKEVSSTDSRLAKRSIQVMNVARKHGREKHAEVAARALAKMEPWTYQTALIGTNLLDMWHLVSLGTMCSLLLLLSYA